MQRRQFVSFLFAAAPLCAYAQKPTRIARIGVMSNARSQAEDMNFARVTERLRELGHVEGKTVTFEYLSTEGRNERLPAVAAEIERRNPDVILTIGGGTPAAIAARNATRTIPIVFTGVADPVGQGIVASLARPGGNVTGMSLQTSETSAKTLELLKEIVPAATRVAVLVNPTNESHALILKEMQAAARRLRIETSVVHARFVEDFEQAIGEARRVGAHGLVVLSDGTLNRYSARLAALGLMHRLPIVGGSPLFTEQGGLLSYGANRAAQYRRATELVDRILKGAKPADLPVEQPTKFDLIVNLKAAKALDITIPQTVLVWADKVIQ